MRRLLPLLLAAVAAALLAPASALASSGSDQIIAECANEQLSKSYSQKDYDQALADLPSDLREYTDCADVIKAAQRAAASKGGGGNAAPRAAGGGTTSGGSGGSGPTTGAAAPSATTGTAPPAATATTASGGDGGAPAAPADAAPAAPAAPAADPAAANEAADAAALQAAQRAGASPIDIGGTTLNPGDPAGVALSLGDLPTPMLVLLGLFGVIALLGLAAALKSWVLGIGRSRDASA